MIRIGRFPDGGLMVTLPESWAARLQRLPDRLEALLDAPQGAEKVVRRLFPRFSDDPEVERELRAVAEADLRQKKRATARAFAERLAAGAPTLLRHRRVRLTPAQADGWIACLNDLRLMLGTLLGIAENDAAQRVERRRPAEGGDEWLYLVLTSLQGTLIEAMED